MYLCFHTELSDSKFSFLAENHPFYQLKWWLVHRFWQLTSTKPFIWRKISRWLKFFQRYGCSEGQVKKCVFISKTWISYWRQWKLILSFQCPLCHPFCSKLPLCIAISFTRELTADKQGIKSCFSGSPTAPYMSDHYARLCCSLYCPYRPN